MSGLITVFRKELADHFTSWRFLILFILVLLAAVFATFGLFGAWGLWGALGSIRGELAQATQFGTTQFVFIKLFTTSGEAIPPFLWFIAFLMPIVGIALGLDAINSEKNSGTLSRLLSQPIYRDAVINGKFLAGVVTIAIMLTSILILIAGMGLKMIGVPPSSEEVIRLLVFLVVSIVYGAFWLGLAILFSVFFRRVATSAVASIAVWLFFFFFIFMLAGVIANMIVPVDQASSTQELLRHEEINLIAMRISPIRLFQEATIVLLNPGERTVGQLLEFVTAFRWMIPNPLPLGQSLLIVWPHLVSLVALTAVCFAISYIKFMREEIRST